VAAAVVDPGEERAGGGEPLLSVLAGGGPQRPAGRAGAHPGELVPNTELAEQLLVGVAVQVVEAAAQPAVVVQELPVGVRQQAAVHEQVTQVDGGAPVRAGGECLMGQGQPADGQVGEQGSDVRRAQPVQGGGRVGAGVQGTGQRREPGRGLVAEEPAGAVGYLAPGAQPPPAVSVGAAAAAVEPAGDAGAVTADGLRGGGAAGQRLVLAAARAGAAGPHGVVQAGRAQRPVGESGGQRTVLGAAAAGDPGAPRGGGWVTRWAAAGPAGAAARPDREPRPGRLRRPCEAARCRRWW
jgi:hypothetical protein